MTLIEGFGDEVVCVIAIVSLALIAVIVWVSTSVADRPRSTIVISGRVTETGTFVVDDGILDDLASPGQGIASSVPLGSTDPPDGRHGGGETETTPRAGVDHVTEENPIETDEEIRAQPDAIKIKLKFVNDSDKAVDARLGEKLKDFKRRNFQSDIAAGKFIRIIFQGRLLSNEEDTLEQHGLFDNCVVHCHVSNNHPRSASNATQSGPGGIDVGSHHPAFHHFNDAALLAQGEFEIELGNWMMPVAGFLLSILWSYWYQFGHFFSFIATVCLTVLTGLFFTVLLGIYSNLWSPPPPPAGNNGEDQRQDEQPRGRAIVTAIWNFVLPLPDFVRNLVGGEAQLAPSHSAQPPAGEITE